jgi:outer membrane immunogenic protein
LQFSTAIATTIFGLGAASAADLPVKAYTKAPAAIAAVYNWNGFYVGANVGYGWGNHHTNLTSDPALSDPTSSHCSIRPTPLRANPPA